MPFTLERVTEVSETEEVSVSRKEPSDTVHEVRERRERAGHDAEMDLIVPALMVCDSLDKDSSERSTEFLAQAFRTRSMSLSLKVASLKLCRDKDVSVL